MAHKLREVRLAYTAIWRARHREQVREYNREYAKKRRQTKRDAILKASRKWKARHPDYERNRRLKLKFAAWARVCASSRSAA